MPIYTLAIPASILLEKAIFFKYTRMPSALLPKDFPCLRLFARKDLT
jgi:hypothetical protein